MKNKYLTIFLLVLLMILPSIFPDNESRYEEWSKSLLCPVCQGETIYDSPSEYADDMGAILLEQINTVRLFKMRRIASVFSRHAKLKKGMN